MKKTSFAMLLGLSLMSMPVCANSLDGWFNAPEGSSELVAATDVAVKNPLAEYVDIKFVGAYGTSVADGKGSVRLVFKIKPLVSGLHSLRIGGNINYPPMLVDEDGNKYEMSLGWYDYDLTDDIYVKVPLKNESLFVGVPQTVATIQKVQVGISISYEKAGLLQLVDVPVAWDKE